MAEPAEVASAPTIGVRVRRIEPQVEYTLRVAPEIRLVAFRELLATPEQSGVPVAQQRLIFRGQVLQDVNPTSGEANTLRTVGVVEDGDTLHLVIRAEAPPQAAAAQQARPNASRVAMGTFGVPNAAMDAGALNGMPQALMSQYITSQLLSMAGAYPSMTSIPTTVSGFAVPVGPPPPAPLDTLETFMTRLSAVLDRSSDNLRVDGPPPPGLAGVEHSSVQCDGCGQNPILRRRFKSLSRVDYDLCETCAASGQHAQHGPFTCLELPIPILVISDPPTPGGGLPPPPPDSTARLGQLGGALAAAEALLTRTTPLVSRAGAALRQEQALAGGARLSAQGATLQAAAALNALGALSLELSRMLGGVHFGDSPTAAALWQRGPVAYIHPLGLQPLTHALPSHPFGGIQTTGPAVTFSANVPQMVPQQRMPMPGAAANSAAAAAAASEAAMTSQIVGAVLSSFIGGMPPMGPAAPPPQAVTGAASQIGQTSVTLNFVAGPADGPLPDGSGNDMPAAAVPPGGGAMPGMPGMPGVSPMMSLLSGMLPMVQQVVGAPREQQPGTAPPAAAVAQILAQSPALQQALGSALGPQTIAALHSALGQIVAAGGEAPAAQPAAQGGAAPPPPPPPPPAQQVQAQGAAASPAAQAAELSAASRAAPQQGRSPFDLTRAVTGAPRSRPGSSPPADSPLVNSAVPRPAPPPPPAAPPPPPAAPAAPPAPAPPPAPAQPAAGEAPAAAFPAPPQAAPQAPAPQPPAPQGGVSLPARRAPSSPAPGAPAGLGAGLGGDLPLPRRTTRRSAGAAPRTPGSAPRATARQAPPEFDMFAQLLGGASPGGPGAAAGRAGGADLGSMMASVASSPAFQQMAGQMLGSFMGEGEGGDAGGGADIGALMSSMMGALGGGPRPGGGGGVGRRRRQVVEEAPWEEELAPADAERWARIIAADEAAMAAAGPPPPLSVAYLFGTSQRAAATAAESAGNA